MTDPLKIGISVILQHSFFSGGGNTVAFSIANALKKLGHIPILINTNGQQEWFEDCKELRTAFEVRNLVDWDAKQYEKLDRFIDIDGYLNPKERRKITNHVCIFIRKPTAIHETEGSIYPIQQPIRSFDCDSIWTWAHFGEQDAYILQLLSQKPVYKIPFTWWEGPVDEYGKGMPTWLETSKQVIADQPWITHITETNSTLISNATIPIVVMSYLKQQGVQTISDYFIHNAQQIEQHAFFKDNILNNTKQVGQTAHFVGRQRITDWRMQPKSVVFSHIRFNMLKTLQLDAVWNGIPVIHNSPILRDLGFGLERFYYPDNSIKGAAQAFSQLNSDWSSSQGFFAPNQLAQIRIAIQTVFNPLIAKDTWNAAIKGLAPPVVNEPIPLQIQPAPLAVQTQPQSTVLRVGFSDMWQDANHEYNFWTLLLQSACDHMNPPRKVVGVKITDENINEPIDLLFFAPFGYTWNRVPTSVPKIHITGEHTPPRHGPGVYLNLGFEATNLSKGIYRFPLWIQYIDWFDADQERLINPRSMPLDSILKPNVEQLQKKDKFCAFVVSNPTNSVRNEAFHWLSQYKQVDSAGRLFNNVGDAIFTNTAGGGGGELKKMEFLQSYKFCLTYENSRGDGYVTEKCLAAKAAGCVPIYWGARDVAQDFAEGSFLDANSFMSPNELIEAVKRLDENPDEWLKMASTPCISLDKERKRLAEVAKLILQPIVSAQELASIPDMLGNESTKQPVEVTVTDVVATDELDAPTETVDWNDKTLLVTFATDRFIPSLKQWLDAAVPRIEADERISARVYLGDDVNSYTYNLLRVEYREVDFKRLPTKSVHVSGFPDLWDAQHFAWKLWILQSIVKEKALAQTLVWYMDCGSIIVRWPEQLFTTTVNSGGLCMLEDPEQKNDQWCQESFCRILNVTKNELAAQQLCACTLAFVGGAKLAWTVFTEAWKYAQIRDVIAGPKWAGLLPDGRPFGHRHDQSILSILRLRHKVPVEPLYSLYNHESLRRTFKSGAALYVHRGNSIVHKNFTKRIGEVHLINLTRRADRIQQFKENHEPWTREVCLRPAYDGRQIKLTPALARLFLPNDFHWKKAVMGCALSHLSLWTELANEQTVCENYLILEDDVKFKPGWLQIWEKAAEEIPDDYDVLYLGGVLPPNRKVYDQVIQPVNEFWGRIQPNRIFGQPTPTSYFHFCNYAYILSRKGAQKILEGLCKRGGYYTSADHMICNRVEDMKHYMLTPLVAGCYQDDDPKYAQSEFNNFSRVDNFDSDLWNNDERFTQEEIVQAMGLWDSESKEIPIQTALVNARESTINKPKTRFYTVGDHKLVGPALMEYKWLQTIIGSTIDTVQQIPLDHEPLDSKPIFICMKPYFSEYVQIFQKYEAAGKEFYAIHLSDEHTTHCPDPIFWYSFRMCKGVIRMYNRPDLQGLGHVHVIPLGPHHMNTQIKDLDQRSLTWSFFGTKWMNREALLESWKQIPGQHKSIFFDTWRDAKQLDAETYSQACLDSIFVPCPGGQNLETFRFYEALEHGAIPILVRQSGDDAYFKLVSDNIPLLSTHSWEHAADFVKTLLVNRHALIQYRTTVLNKWAEWKNKLKETCRSALVLEA
jgi:GR25 family glycosyltransferase involved in LPS biosynthesis